MADNHWTETPGHPVTDWQYDVANGDTRLGYAAWVGARVENDAPSAPTTVSAAQLYKFKFSRDYTISESFERIIRAPSLAEAEAAAANLAQAFNHDCPDDCSEDEGGNTEIGDFEAECTSSTVHKASDPDFVVCSDGQCLPYPVEDEADG